MACLARLALVFVVLPVVELVILIRLGATVGLWPTLGLVLVTGAAGAALARAEGLKVVLQLQSELAAGRPPAQSLLDGASILLSGVLLLTPGLLTDVAALALLVPWSRRWIQRRVLARLQAGIRTGALQVVVMSPGGLGMGRGTETSDLDPRHEIRVDDPE
jgi:UPF0716 protein FxsA